MYVMKTMVVIMAHPDEESFFVGGTIAKYVKSGWTVHLVLATKGDAGENSLEGETSTLAQLRAKEAEEAGTILGIASITYLGYQDNTLSRRKAGDIEDTVFKALEALSPDIVITHEPQGIFNNPDTIKLSYATTFAFQKYANLVIHGEKLGSRDPKRYLIRHDEEESTEPKLYYACMPASIVEFLQKQGAVLLESNGKSIKGVHDKHISTVIDISRFSSVKQRAIECHKTQQEDINRFFSISNHPLLEQEYFIQRLHGETEVFMKDEDRIANRL
jgi:LmbE family N-acetylglucosaminyl deacetylase